MTVTAVDERLRQIALILDREIADLGYPVGMGMAPHPDTTKRIAGAIAIAIEAELLAARKEIAGLREGLANSEARARELEGAIGDRTEIPESPAARKAMLAYYRRMVELYEATK